MGGLHARFEGVTYPRARASKQAGIAQVNEGERFAKKIAEQSNQPSRLTGWRNVLTIRMASKWPGRRGIAPQIVRVLITNQSLDRRPGRDTFAEDWAKQMQARGIRVAAYSSALAHLERFLEIDPIPVVTRPDGLMARPDVIHARHPLDAISLLSALPGVPAVYQVVEGVWEDLPPVHPRIRHYLVHSEQSAEVVAEVSGFGGDRITLCPPLIDSGRFPRRGCAGQIRRALLLRNAAGAPAGVLSLLQAMADEFGIDIWHGGPEFAAGNATMLAGFDLVLTSGWHAWEAMAAGCAVIPVHEDLVGPLVRPGNFEQLARSNFRPGRGTGTDTVSLLLELGGYSAEDTAAVMKLVRDRTDPVECARRMVSIYTQVTVGCARVRDDFAAEMIAAARFLCRTHPVLDDAYRRLGRRWPATSADSGLPQTPLPLSLK